MQITYQILSMQLINLISVTISKETTELVYDCISY